MLPPKGALPWVLSSLNTPPEWRRSCGKSSCPCSRSAQSITEKRNAVKLEWELLAYILQLVWGKGWGASGFGYCWIKAGRNMGVRIWGLKEPQKPRGHVQGVGDRHNFCWNSYTGIMNMDKNLLVYYVRMPVHKTYIYINACLYIYLETNT